MAMKTGDVNELTLINIRKVGGSIVVVRSDLREIETGIVLDTPITATLVFTQEGEPARTLRWVVGSPQPLQPAIELQAFVGEHHAVLLALVNEGVANSVGIYAGAEVGGN